MKFPTQFILAKVLLLASVLSLLQFASPTFAQSQYDERGAADSPASPYSPSYSPTEDSSSEEDYSESDSNDNIWNEGPKTNMKTFME